MRHTKDTTLAEAIFGQEGAPVPLNRLNSVLTTLRPRDEKVLRKRYGVAENGHKEPGCTLEETGKEFGITGERVRQIEARGLRYLRHPRRRKLLDSFISITKGGNYAHCQMETRNSVIHHSKRAKGIS